MTSTKSFLYQIFLKDSHLILTEYSLVISHLRNLVHLGARWAPWVVAGGLSDLCLSVRVALGVVFGGADDPLAEVLHGGHASASQTQA